MGGPGGKVSPGKEFRKPDVVPKTPLKKLFWNPISLNNCQDVKGGGGEAGGGEGTIWEKIHREGVVFDEGELEVLFAEGPHGARGGGGGAEAAEVEARPPPARRPAPGRCPGPAPGS